MRLSIQCPNCVPIGFNFAVVLRVQALSKRIELVFLDRLIGRFVNHHILFMYLRTLQFGVVHSKASPSVLEVTFLCRHFRCFLSFLLDLACVLFEYNKSLD